jgi:hypothetical protein
MMRRNRAGIVSPATPRPTRVHEITVSWDKVIFPASFFGAVMAALGRQKPGKQTTMQVKIQFGEDAQE